MSGKGPVPAIVLAAGASRRLGRAKQMVMLGGETLLERAVRVAGEAGLEPVLVVLAAANDFGYGAQSLNATVIYNHDAAEGMAASARCGVAAAQLLGASGVVVMTCDQPGVTAEHLRALVGDVRTGSKYAGRVGVPAYFPAEDFAQLMELRGDHGARELLREARTVVNEALALDVDTEDDVVAAVGMFGRSA